MPPLPEIATLTLPIGRFAFVYARGREDATAHLAERRASLTPDYVHELTEIPLTPMQASMVYPELFHGHLTANTVAYIIKSGSFDQIDPDLEEIATCLGLAFPLVTAVVVESDDGLAFRLPKEEVLGEHLVFRAERDFIDERDCISFLLYSPISLFQGPLLRLGEVDIRGQRHLAVLFHHILGDHIGQLQLLRALMAFCASGKVAVDESLPDLTFVPESLKLEKRHGDAVERSLDFWAGYGERAAVSSLSHQGVGVIWHQTEIALPWTRYSRLQWAAMRAYRSAIDRLSGTTDPLVLCLFSLREKPQGLGFYTVAAPILFEDELLGIDDMPEDFHDRMEAFRNHSIVGSEEIQAATGWDAGQISYLFNFVTMPEEDLLWMKTTLLDAPSENPRTDVDLTFIVAGAQLHLHLASRLDEERRALFLNCFLETLKDSL
ncbi:hypothetical protein [Agrobacterium vitis]|uniref:Condensation domain-containing protein n=1 Tax=Agrobacterium vitis TaxID=373 RepID=A0A7K1RKK8_AGRVI|nr:hypothetical protein [Agrobacterium vitis]MVA58558.1 hypothetical protein [Agrobacterium vitis]